jgi:hypothetical protein
LTGSGRDFRWRLYNTIVDRQGDSGHFQDIYGAIRVVAAL